MIKFFYFDLGRVLLDFTHERGFEQIARVAGISPETVKSSLFDKNDLSNSYERGEISTQEFHQKFCETTNTNISCDELTQAWSDIFTVIPGTFRLAASLRSAGHRIGILSNTCAAHWEFAAKRFKLLDQIFDPVVTSYDVKSMKPDAAIYSAAAQQVGYEGEEIFFVDDRMENVEGASAAGWTAVQFQSPLQLANELQGLGVHFNR